MSQASTPQERVAAARQLYAVLRMYLDRSTWTPAEGALVLSGLHAPAGCVELPREAMGLDGRPFAGDVIDRLTKAREIMRLWDWSWDDQDSNVIAPTQLAPHEFLAWCQDVDIDTEWLHLIFEVISGGKVQTDQPDLIPLAVAEYAAHSAETISAIHTLAGRVSVDSSVSAPVPTQVQKSAPQRVPMPIPTNRDHVSTEELAAILAIDPQSIRKRHSVDGSYLGIRPTKLPNRRLLWPVADVKKLLSGGRLTAPRS